MRNKIRNRNARWRHTLAAGERFKSKGYGSASSSNARREKQAQAVAEIYRNRVGHHPKVAVVGDLNDTPAGAPLVPLIQQTDLKDVMSHPLYLNGNDRRPACPSR